jgi:hypothetical protein
MVLQFKVIASRVSTHAEVILGWDTLSHSSAGHTTDH